MKKIKLLIPTALCAITPIICATSCSTTGIGAPDVTLDAGQNKTVTIGPDKTFSFNFTLSKDMPDGMTLREAFFSSSVDRKYQWAAIKDEHPTITNKKLTITFSTEGCSGYEQHPDINGKMFFVFKNSQGEESKEVSGFTFKYQA